MGWIVIVPHKMSNNVFLSSASHGRGFGNGQRSHIVVGIRAGRDERIKEMRFFPAMVMVSVRVSIGVRAG